jgi:hypothetical protein
LAATKLGNEIMKTAIAVVVLLGFLALAVYVSVRVWIGLGEVEISGGGIAALVLGTLFTLALGGGLMFLVFYSSRHGHDDDVG